MKIGQIFTIHKNKKQVRWKVVEHPYFNGQLALVKDYKGLYGARGEWYEDWISGKKSEYCQKAYKQIYRRIAGL